MDAARHVGDRERHRPPPRARTGSRPGTAGRRARLRARRSSRGRCRRSARRPGAPRSPRRLRRPPRARDGATSGASASASHGQPPGPRRRSASATSRANSERDRELTGVDEHRREVIGLDVAVELRERDRDDVLVGKTEPLQHGDLVLGGSDLEQRELHVREHEPACRTARSASAHPCPAASIANARASTTRTPPSGSMPRRAHARSAKDTPGTISTSTFAAAQQLNRLLRDVRTAGHRVHDLAVRVRGVDDIRRDRAVHRVEVVARRRRAGRATRT